MDTSQQKAIFHMIDNLYITCSWREETGRSDKGTFILNSTGSHLYFILQKGFHMLILPVAQHKHIANGLFWINL